MLYGDDLLAWYRFDANNGHDDSGNGNNALTLYQMTFADGLQGRTAVFDGDLSYITLPELTHTTEFTKVALIYPESDECLSSSCTIMNDYFEVLGTDLRFRSDALVNTGWQVAT